MICPGHQRGPFVLQRTIHALFCLAAFACLFVVQNPISDDRSSETLTEDCALFYVTAAEAFQTDDCGSTCQNAIDLARVDFYQLLTGNNPAAPALTSAVESAPGARPDLSPPLVV